MNSKKGLLNPDGGSTFKQFKTLIENQIGKKIKRLRIDNGMEFCLGEFDRFYSDEGIVRHHTVRKTPQQNGVAERMNMTLLEKARCVLSNSGLGKEFLIEAVSVDTPFWTVQITLFVDLLLPQ